MSLLGWVGDHVLEIVTTLLAAIGGAFAKRLSSPGATAVFKRDSTSFLGRRWNLEKRNQTQRDQIGTLEETIQELESAQDRQRASWKREREDLERQLVSSKLDREDLERRAIVLLDRNEQLVSLVENLTDGTRRGSLTVSVLPPSGPNAPSATSSPSSKKSKD